MAQCMNYLKACNLEICLLLNFFDRGWRLKNHPIVFREDTIKQEKRNVKIICDYLRSSVAKKI